MLINYTIDTPLTATITIDISTADYLPKFEERIKKACKEATIKGFRPGQVPKDLIKKMYGDELLADVLQNQVWDSMNGYLESEKLNTFGSPIAVVGDEDKNIVDYKNPTDMVFRFDVGLVPEFDIEFDASKKLITYKVVITDDLLKEAVNTARIQFGSYQISENVALQGYLTVAFKPIDAPEDIESKDASILLEWFKEGPLREQVLAAKKDDIILIENVYEAFSKPVKEINQFLLNKEGNKEELVENVAFNMHIIEIKALQLAELGEEFYQLCFPNATITNEQEFENELKADYERYFNEHEQAQLNQDIMQYLHENITFDLPLGYLLRLVNEKNNTNETTLNNNVIEQVRNEILQMKIQKENNINLTYDDVVNHYTDTFKNSLRKRADYDTIDESTLRKMIEKKYQDNREEFNKDYDKLVSSKINDYILTKANLEEKMVSLEEFKKITTSRSQNQ